jgi:hypothetical protein
MRSPGSRRPGRAAPILPMLPGTPERATHDHGARAPPASTRRWISPRAR